jgi:predicted transcriptional regulator
MKILCLFFVLIAACGCVQRAHSFSVLRPLVSSARTAKAALPVSRRGLAAACIENAEPATKEVMPFLQRAMTGMKSAAEAVSDFIFGLDKLESKVETIGQGIKSVSDDVKELEEKVKRHVERSAARAKKRKLLVKQMKVTVGIMLVVSLYILVQVPVN